MGEWRWAGGLGVGMGLFGWDLALDEGVVYGARGKEGGEVGGICFGPFDHSPF
ncbi:hypothetical protein J2Z37_004988 [Ammoniphilus resinae]|uniref:Uncharacterized protein n=1 Tax=Ammoniphilus resinae TaxID=861532 RepID=A0ABS4GXG6_9BACL|nr:hypothetical protein [Ammoniphilus resinae]